MTVYAGQYGPDDFDTASKDPLRAAVAVYVPGTTTHATLYTSRTKAVAAANPVFPDAQGNVVFWAEPGWYDVFVNGKTFNVPVYRDPLEPPPVNGEVLILVSETGADLLVGAGTITRALLTSNPIVVFSGAGGGVASGFTLILEQDDVGGRVPVFTDMIQWVGGSPTPPSTAPGTIDVYTFLSTDGGATWLGFYSGSV